MRKPTSKARPESAQCRPATSSPLDWGAVSLARPGQQRGSQRRRAAGSRPRRGSGSTAAAAGQRRSSKYPWAPAEASESFREGRAATTGASSPGSASRHAWPRSAPHHRDPRTARRRATPSRPSLTSTHGGPGAPRPSSTSRRGRRPCCPRDQGLPGRPRSCPVRSSLAVRTGTTPALHLNRLHLGRSCCGGTDVATDPERQGEVVFSAAARPTPRARRVPGPCMERVQEVPGLHSGSEQTPFQRDDLDPAPTSRSCRRAVEFPTSTPGQRTSHRVAASFPAFHRRREARSGS